jgi:[ribosomal protein S5]-alanine N-acetyltransferase
VLTADIQTERFVLSCLEESDATDTYRAWMEDPRVTRFLETDGAGVTLESLREYIRAVRESPDSYLFGIFSRTGRVHHGNIKLGPVSARHRNAGIGLIIGDAEIWGTGVATEVVGALSAWAFEALGLAKLYAGIYETNVGSTRAFERNGFVIEGRLRQQVDLEGSRENVLQLGRTRDDPATGR